MQLFLGDGGWKHLAEGRALGTGGNYTGRKTMSGGLLPVSPQHASLYNCVMNKLFLYLNKQ